MKKIILFAAVYLLPVFLSAEYRNDTVLFCLKKEVTPLIIHSAADRIQVSHPELQKYLLSVNMKRIERWLPSAVDTDHDGDIYLNRIYRLTLDERSGVTPDRAAQDLQKFAFIHSAEREPIRRPFYTPNDPRYGQQWFLPQIGANDAWDFWNIPGGEIPGGANVILASIDTGVDWDHTDLVNNIWQNLNEDADGDGRTIEYIDGNWVLDPGDLNGIDDDDWDGNPNTHIDDLIGWDLSGWNGNYDNDPIPKQGVSNYSVWAHGTHVAGLLSATTDNSAGIASAAFNSRIMCVKVSRENQTGTPYITEGYAGILYAAQAGYYAEGFAILNNSWGGVGYNQYEQVTINVAHDTYNALIVAAGGNGEEYGGELEQAHYPSSYDNVISVAPIGSNDVWHHWATYHSTIDISSPGENIHSTVINNNYATWDGSSMASPIVASVLGLMRSYHPDWDILKMETMLLATADPVIYEVNSEPYLQGKLGVGRVDALKAIETPLFPIIDLAGTDILPVEDLDGQLNGGDVLEFFAIIFTDPGWGTATGITGQLTTDSPDVQIPVDTAEFWDLAPGDAAINESSPFMIELMPGIPEGPLTLTLTITSNQNDFVGYTVDFPIQLEIAGSSFLYGDMNNDGTLDVLDAVTMVTIIMGDILPTEYQLNAGDMNSDGVIDVLDVITLMNQIIG